MSRSPKLYQQVAETITAAIRRGDHPPGARLPSERDLLGMVDILQRGLTFTCSGRRRQPVGMMLLVWPAVVCQHRIIRWASALRLCIWLDITSAVKLAH